jgi:tRNA pseudouridine38-40 synthase
VAAPVQGYPLAGHPAQAPARRLALVVEYDGTAYQGFQAQVGQPTIQGEIERALHRFTGEVIRIRGASRTDAGAHALGQVVDFLTYSAYPVDVFPRALNFYLPPDIKVQAACEVAPEFHSRKNATSRIYRYYILNRPWPSPLRRQACHRVAEPLDEAKMAAAARDLVGRHDFRPLATGYPANRSTVRTVYRWDVWREDDTVIVECEADGFLRHQIRRASALLIEIGKGRCPEGMIRDLLDGKVEGTVQLPSVPGYGLCLMKVTYPNSCSQVRTANEKD